MAPSNWAPPSWKETAVIWAAVNPCVSARSERPMTAAAYQIREAAKAPHTSSRSLMADLLRPEKYSLLSQELIKWKLENNRRCQLNLCNHRHGKNPKKNHGMALTSDPGFCYGACRKEERLG